jgi:hypothetical protein
MGTCKNMDMRHVFTIFRKLQLNNFLLHYDSLFFYIMLKLLFLFKYLQCVGFDAIHNLALWEHTNFVMAIMIMFSNQLLKLDSYD